MPPPVPMQERGLRTIYDRIPVLRHDVAGREEWQGISVVNRAVRIGSGEEDNGTEFSECPAGSEQYR